MELATRDCTSVGAVSDGKGKGDRTVEVCSESLSRPSPLLNSRQSQSSDFHARHVIRCGLRAIQPKIV